MACDSIRDGSTGWYIVQCEEEAIKVCVCVCTCACGDINMATKMYIVLSNLCFVQLQVIIKL